MIDHSYISSFKEYLDYKIIKKTNSFDDKTLPLIAVSNDDRMKSFNIYSGGERQFIYDGSVLGFHEPVIKNGGSIVSVAHIDYNNSRLLLNKPSTLTNGSIEVFCKRFNSYLSTSADEEIFNKMYPVGSKEVLQPKAYKGDSYYSPCYFVKSFSSSNEGFALGGTDKTKFTFKVSCFVNNEYDLFLLQGAMRDLNGTSAYILNTTPLNEFGDLKNHWNYENQSQAARLNGNNKIHIENVYFNTLKSDNVVSKFPNSYIGVATFETWVTRNPRV